jgi:hypothetical protein
MFSLPLSLSPLRSSTTVNVIIKCRLSLNPLMPELNPSAQSRLPTFLMGILIFKRLTARHVFLSLSALKG